MGEPREGVKGAVAPPRTGTDVYTAPPAGCPVCGGAP